MPRHVPELNSPNTLAELYRQYTTREIAARLGCSQSAVSAAVQRHQLRIIQRTARHRRRLAQLDDRDWLAAQYLVATTHQIAVILGCSQAAVLDALHRLAIPVLGHGRRLRKSKYRLRRGPDGELVKEHRLVMAQLLGRDLLPTEHVHHKDGNGLNNDTDNLVILTKSAHHRLHGCSYQRVCRTCGTDFSGGNRALYCPTHRRKRSSPP